jgi:hypothetical protein
MDMSGPRPLRVEAGRARRTRANSEEDRRRQRILGRLTPVEYETIYSAATAA